MLTSTLIGKKASHQRSDERSPKIGVIVDVMKYAMSKEVKEVRLDFADHTSRWVSLSLVTLLPE